ncbi:glycosyltransferase family 4 protein [Paenibacillus sp. SC116]|uniref:glycosyltransferase family 4 protein n=1 Tax=Paenibacillus sp. SC116 TaxID=2968986 RepID=UPI00215B70C3|nr:glycosyltransferase family 4 protein [Paenibacillus sp. SC116]MCR8843210.1 glycosyltransferase family 4 protein [Paenibacillus sp. SC116]
MSSTQSDLLTSSKDCSKPPLSSRSLRIGYIDGQPKRVNERAVDDQWVAFMKEHAELVAIKPFQMMKLFGGSIPHWHEQYPHSTDTLIERLRSWVQQTGVNTIYVNVPAIIPYLMHARNQGHIPLRFFIIAHSVGSEYWLKQWVAIAPLLQPEDTLLCTTNSAYRALLNISPVYEMALQEPLCISISACDEPRMKRRDEGRARQLLCIGRVEDVKNIHHVIELAHLVRTSGHEVHLMIAGEYTGANQAQLEHYRSRLQEIENQFESSSYVTWTGAVYGSQKEKLLAEADILLNLSTDPGETFGYNLLEAKAAGIPVVCTKWDGFKDIVTEHVDGMFIPVHWETDIPQLDVYTGASIVCNLLSDERLLANMRNEAREQAKRFDYKRVMPRIIEHLAAQASIPMVTFDQPRENLLHQPISEIHDYSTPFLHHLDWEHRHILSLLAESSAFNYEQWMPLCKPIIGHFADGGIT